MRNRVSSFNLTIARIGHLDEKKTVERNRRNSWVEGMVGLKDMLKFALSPPYVHMNSHGRLALSRVLPTPWMLLIRSPKSKIDSIETKGISRLPSSKAAFKQLPVSLFLLLHFSILNNTSLIEPPPPPSSHPNHATLSSYIPLGQHPPE